MFLEGAAAAGSINEDVVARLELIFLRVLRHDSSPTLLHKRMGEDPSLFIEAACLAYRADGEPEHQIDEETSARALLAEDLLSGWQTPPGLESGVIDAARLQRWVNEVRYRLAEVNRAAVGDYLIGHLLSGSPRGSDGAWPAEPVRDLIDELRSEKLETGLRIGRFNQGGAVWRNPVAGGNVEWGMKAEYDADAATVAAKWPRTAAFLRAFAATYGHDAVREDVSAELRHDLGG
jgi:hypothetical protein